MDRFAVVVVAVATILAMTAPEAVADRREATALVEAGKRAASSGQVELGLRKLTEAMSIDPDYLPAYDAAVPLWLDQGALAEIAKFLEVATTRQRDYAFGWYTLGYVYRVRGRPELSVIAYETYLQLRPKDPDPRFGLALALIDQGKNKRAELELKRYLRLEKRPERSAFVTRAEDLVRHLGGVVPVKVERSASSELDRAEALSTGYRFASALAVLASIETDVESERHRQWLLRASAHLGAGRSQAAIAAGFVALGLGPGDREALSILAAAFDNLGARGGIGEYLRSLAAPSLSPSAAPTP